MDNELEILISAVDDASETMAEVGTSAQEMGDQIDEALSSAGETVSETTAGISSSLQSQNESFALAAEIATQSDQEIIDTMLEFGVNAQTAAEIVVESNTEIEASSEEAATASKASYGALAAVAGAGFYALSGAISSAISNAAAWDKTSAEITQELKDTGSAIPLSQIQAYAQQVQGLTLFNQQDALSSEALLMSHKDLQSSYQSLTILSADLATKMNTDLPNATRMLTNALADPVAGINQLIRQGNIDFPAATVTMIENMAKAGDTAGADAALIQALSGQIGGLAVAAANAQGGALTQLGNQLGTLSTVIGNDLIPLLDNFAKDMMPVITAITAWTEAHPKLTDAIIIGTVAVVGLLLVIGLAGIAAMAFSAALTALGTVAGTIGVVILALASPFVLLGIAIAALAIIAILRWNDIVANFQALGLILQTNIHTLLSAIQTDWQTMWNAIGGFFENIWQGIINDLKSAINTVITILDDLIAGIDSLQINIPAIQIPGTKIGTPAVNIGFDIPQIPHLATGGIVSVPTVALIGEAGPEAIVPLGSSGASSATGLAQGQQIVINIQGGTYLDQQGATIIAEALVHKIQQQLKLTSFR